MKFQQIRGATSIITYGGKNFLRVLMWLSVNGRSGTGKFP